MPVPTPGSPDAIAYEAGWRASARTTTADLDAAEARFEARHGRDFGGTSFAAGWVDLAVGNPKWTALTRYDDLPDQRPTIDASIPSPQEEPTMAPLDNDHPTLPADEVWNEETGETFGEARARFATFGPEVPATMVPALVRAGVTVWSFGYGDDPEDFTTIDESDLDGTDWTDPADTGVWAPFRIDALTPDAERILAGVEPTVAPYGSDEPTPEALADATDALRLGADEPFAPALEAAREAASLSTDSLLRRTIVGVMEEVTGPGVLTHGEAADIIIRALVSEGFAILSADDQSWGECPGNDGGPHVVSLSLCAGCLEYDPE